MMNRLSFVYTLLVLCLYQYGNGQAPSLYPTKQGGKWGLADASGRQVLKAEYDAIGSFRKHGYAVVQRDGKVGLIKQDGTLTFSPKYEDIKVISKTLFGIREDSVQVIINLRGQHLLHGYDRTELLQGGFVRFWRDNRCGILSPTGQLLLDALFKRVRLSDGGRYFRIHRNGKTGLADLKGKIIAPVKYRETRPLHPDFILVKTKYKWGALNGEGKPILPEQFSSYEETHHDHVMMYKQEHCRLYSIARKGFVGKEAYEHFILLNGDWIVFQKHGKVGLMDSVGELVIPPGFDEIQAYAEGVFRVRSGTKWGLVGATNELLTPVVLDYVSPFGETHAFARKGGKHGLVGADGRMMLNTIYDKLEVDSLGKVKAYRAGGMTVFNIPPQGGITKEEEYKEWVEINIKKAEVPRVNLPIRGNYQLAGYEWFYDAEKRKWGLRNLADGSERLPPQFDFVDIKREHGFTIAGNTQTVKQNFGDIAVRFQKHFCLVNNAEGVRMTNVDLREIRLDDYHQGNPTARVVFDNGRHGLVDRMGRIVCKGYAYIGEYKDGLAAMAMHGRISVARREGDFVICPMDEYLIGSYGRYLIGDFGHFPRRIPGITCHDCAWGYIDTLGRMMVPPDYDAARRFGDGVGIVKKGGKWGLVNQDAEEVVACHFDKISRMEAVRGSLLHMEQNCNKYGLIDSLGNMVSHAQYQEIREEQEGLIAVRQNDRWGFINKSGKLAIPFNYVKVGDFSEGKAAAFDGSGWGFINKYGGVAIDFKYPRVGNFNSGLVWVNTAKGAGYLNEAGEFVILPRFKKAYDFEDGIARVVEKDKIQLIDTKGNSVSSQSFDDLSSFDEYGLAVARSSFRDNISYYLVNREGERLSGASWRRIYPFSEGLAAVQKKGKFGFINTRGEVVVSPVYDKVSIFSEGMAWVKQDGNCGYINRLGKVVVDLEFAKCKDFEDGKAVVYVNARKGGLLDKEGGYVIRPSIKRLLDFSEGHGMVRDNNHAVRFIRESGEFYDGSYDSAEPFVGETAFVEIKGKWGVINRQGIMIISPKYEKIERMDNGLVKVEVSRLHGIYRPNGTNVAPIAYEYVSHEGGGVIRVEQGGKLGYLNIQGEWIWEMGD